jgi:hypothetical protein
MYYKITVRNLEIRILNIAQKEANLQSQILRKIDSIGEVDVLFLMCSNAHEIPSVVDTLETGMDVHVLFVEDEDGTHVDFRGFARQRKPMPFISRHTLALAN